MEWSKIKTIIILILLILNAFLLAIVGGQELQSRRIREENREQAVELLAANGIAVDAGALPQELSLPTLTFGSGEDIPAGQSLARVLLGEDLQQEESGVRALYESALGQMEAYATGRFTAQLAQGAHPLAGQSEEAHAQALLEQMGLEVRFSSRQERLDGASVTFQQLWNGYPVFNCQVTLIYQGEALRELEGTLLPPQTSSSRQEETLTVPTLLVRFLSQRNESGQMFSQILSMTPGYRFSGSRPFTLTPVWHFSTDTGEYLLSALDGSLLS